MRGYHFKAERIKAEVLPFLVFTECSTVLLNVNKSLYHCRAVFHKSRLVLYFRIPWNVTWYRWKNLGVYFFPPKRRCCFGDVQPEKRWKLYAGNILM